MVSTFLPYQAIYQFLRVFFYLDKNEHWQFILVVLFCCVLGVCVKTTSCCARFVFFTFFYTFYGMIFCYCAADVVIVASCHCHFFLLLLLQLFFFLVAATAAFCCCFCWQLGTHSLTHSHQWWNIKDRLTRSHIARTIGHTLRAPLSVTPSAQSRTNDPVNPDNPASTGLIIQLIQKSQTIGII